MRGPVEKRRTQGLELLYHGGDDQMGSVFGPLVETEVGESKGIGEYRFSPKDLEP